MLCTGWFGRAGIPIFFCTQETRPNNRPPGATSTRRQKPVAPDGYAIYHELAPEPADVVIWRDRREMALKVTVAGILAGEADDFAAAQEHFAEARDLAAKLPDRRQTARILMNLGVIALYSEEYEAALKHTPNRYRAFWGAARAADAMGNRTQASEYFGKLVNLAKNADAERQEVREAKAFLARQ